MLVLKRKMFERVRLRLPNGDEVWVAVIETGRDSVRLGFEAPRSVQIMREELLEPQGGKRHGE